MSPAPKGLMEEQPWQRRNLKRNRYQPGSLRRKRTRTPISSSWSEYPTLISKERCTYIWPFLPKVKGIGRRVSIRIVDNLEFDRYKRIGDLTDDEVDKIQHALENIHEILPHWMMNRQKDYDSGDDIHVTSSEVQMTRRDDINRLKKVRAYRGIRHERGHKVRGQRLKSNGRTGLVLGVSRKRR